MLRMKALCARAREVSAASAPITWTSTCCTGRAAIPSRRRCGRWRNWRTTGLTAPSASATSMCRRCRRRNAPCAITAWPANQVLYHLGDRGIERKLIPYCRRRGIAVVGYSPFGSGGGFPSPRSAGGRALAAVAGRHGLTPRQVVLQFLLRGDAVFVIPKSSSPAHTRENAGALDTRWGRTILPPLTAPSPRPITTCPWG